VTLNRTAEYSGTFTVRTNVGDVTGNAAGSISLGGPPADVNLALTVTGGTGVFAGSGGLTFTAQWFWTGTQGTVDKITGKVTVP
jgi:hypothetical protein